MKKKSLNKKKSLHGITQSELAKSLRIKHNSIIGWRKKGKIPAEKCFIIAKIYKIKPTTLWDKPAVLLDMLKK